MENVLSRVTCLLFIPLKRVSNCNCIYSWKLLYKYRIWFYGWWMFHYTCVLMIVCHSMKYSYQWFASFHESYSVDSKPWKVCGEISRSGHCTLLFSTDLVSSCAIRDLCYIPFKPIVWLKSEYTGENMTIPWVWYPGSMRHQVTGNYAIDCVVSHKQGFRYQCYLGVCKYMYRETSNLSPNKSQNLNDSRIVLQLSLLNPLTPGVQWRMKKLERRGQALLQLYLGESDNTCKLWIEPRLLLDKHSCQQ